MSNSHVFGLGCPSRNLAFPSGNITVVEMLCYLPQSLKSIDVVIRFANNGAKSPILAAIINKHRAHRFGDGHTLNANSVQSLMQCAMRNSGFAGWTVKGHEKITAGYQADLAPWDASNVSVTGFRPQRVTHPKKNSQKVNLEAAPVEFRDLALHVKKHPEGDDALDLTRCVLYAVAHPDETWKYPTDFQALVTHLKGPTNVTAAHSDAHTFQRYADQIDISIATQTTKSAPPEQNVTSMARTRSTAKAAKPKATKSTPSLSSSNRLTKQTSKFRNETKISHTPSPYEACNELATPDQNLKLHDELGLSNRHPFQEADNVSAPKDQVFKRHGQFDLSSSPSPYDTGSIIAPPNQMFGLHNQSEFSNNSPLYQAGSVHAPTNHMELHHESDPFNMPPQHEAGDELAPKSQMFHLHDDFGLSNSALECETGGDFAPPRTKKSNKRKRRLDDDDNAEYKVTETSHESENDMVDDFGESPSSGSPVKRRCTSEHVAARIRPVRRAAKKARTQIHKYTASIAPQRVASPPLSPTTRATTVPYATTKYRPTPAYVLGPVVSPMSPQVDIHTVHLYAEIGAQDVWASALDYKRFGGPRQYAPFRELYRLSDPDKADVSDWAENIRWAKEQWVEWGSGTWTEYDHHLEMITEHRREVGWVSEEMICFG